MDLQRLRCLLALFSYPIKPQLFLSVHGICSGLRTRRICGEAPKDPHPEHDQKRRLFAREIALPQFSHSCIQSLRYLYYVCIVLSTPVPCSGFDLQTRFRNDFAQWIFCIFLIFTSGMNLLFLHILYSAPITMRIWDM